MRLGYEDEEGKKLYDVKCICGSKNVTDIDMKSHSMGDFDIVALTIKCNECYFEWIEADINLYIDSY